MVAYSYNNTVLDNPLLIGRTIKQVEDNNCLVCWSHAHHVTSRCTWSTAKVVRWLQLHATSPLCTSASFAQPVVDQAPRPPAGTRSRQTQVHPTAGEDNAG